MVWLRVLKGGILLFWLLVLTSLFQVFPEPLTRFIGWVAVIILLIHLAEVAVFTRDFQQRFTEPKFERLQVLVFGVVHLAELRKRHDQRTEGKP